LAMITSVRSASCKCVCVRLEYRMEASLEDLAWAAMQRPFASEDDTTQCG
jgi:hypothetical protein